MITSLTELSASSTLPVSDNSYRVTTYFAAPLHWTEDDIEAAVREEMPHESCHHDHDCCGGHYGRVGRIRHIDFMDDYQLVLVTRDYLINV